MTFFGALEVAVATLFVGAPVACVALAAVVDRRNRGGVAVQITPFGDEDAPLVILDETARGMEGDSDDRSDLESEKSES